MKMFISILALVTFLATSVVREVHFHEHDSMDTECSVCLVGSSIRPIANSKKMTSLVINDLRFISLPVSSITLVSYKSNIINLEFARGPPVS